MFEILIIHKPSLGSCEVPQQIWARLVQPFWRLLDTNKQTDTQTSKVYIFSEFVKIVEEKVKYYKVSRISLLLFIIIFIIYCFFYYSTINISWQCLIQELKNYFLSDIFQGKHFRVWGSENIEIKRRYLSIYLLNIWCCFKTFFKGLNPKENKIYIRVEFRQSFGMNFVSTFQPEREFKVYKACKCSQIICSRVH